MEDQRIPPTNQGKSIQCQPLNHHFARVVKKEKMKPSREMKTRERMPKKPVYACIWWKKGLLHVLVIWLVEEEVGG
jgi:hypothetical protein